MAVNEEGGGQEDEPGWWMSPEDAAALASMAQAITEQNREAFAGLALAVRSMVAPIDRMAADLAAALTANLRIATSGLAVALANVDLAAMSAVAEATLDAEDAAAPLELPPSVPLEAREVVLLVMRCVAAGGLLGALATLPREEAVRQLVLVLAGIFLALQQSD
jgi:hypothetical protein